MNRLPGRGGAWSAHRVLPLAILVIMLGFAGVNVVRVAQDARPERIAGTPADVAPPVDSLTLEQAGATARARAAQWSPDAFLTHVSLQVDWPLDDQRDGAAQFPPGGWARFAFTDPDRGAMIEIVVERYSGTILDERIVDWPDSSHPPLPLDATPVTSRDAVLLAETAIGQRFRLACPATRHRIDMTLAAATGSDGALSVPADVAGTPVAVANGTPTATPVGREPVWLVTYRDDRYPGMNAVEIEVGAESGALLAIRDQSLPCG